MYIRWKKTKRAKAQATLHIAYLAENKRVDGKPRQTVIYLASIQDIQFTQTQHQIQFWQNVERKIKALNLPSDKVAVMREKLQQRVPLPDVAEVQAPTEKHKVPKKVPIHTGTQGQSLVNLWEFTAKHGVAVDDVRRNMRMGMLHPIKQDNTLMLDTEGQRAFWELNHDYHKGWWRDCPDCPHL